MAKNDWKMNGGKWDGAGFRWGSRGKGGGEGLGGGDVCSARGQTVAPTCVEDIEVTLGPGAAVVQTDDVDLVLLSTQQSCDVTCRAGGVAGQFLALDALGNRHV